MKHPMESRIKNILNDSAVRRLEECADIRVGYTPSNNENRRSNLAPQVEYQYCIYLLQPSNIDRSGVIEWERLEKIPAPQPKTDYSVVDTHALHEGQVLLCLRGSIRAVHLSYKSLSQKRSLSEMGGRLLASGAWAVINPKPKILSAAYLCWQLNHPSLIERLKSTQIGSAMPFLKIASIRDLMVTVPSLETQNSISKIVDLIETTSALETKRTQLLRTMLSSILTTQNPRRGARGVKPNPNGDTSL
jgi:hypothetical protein